MFLTPAFIGFRTFYGRISDVLSAEMMKKMEAVITAKEKLNVSGEAPGPSSSPYASPFSWIRFAGN
jgi:hypothetical protein